MYIYMYVFSSIISHAIKIGLSDTNLLDRLSPSNSVFTVTNAVDNLLFLLFLLSISLTDGKFRIFIRP